MHVGGFSAPKWLSSFLSTPFASSRNYSETTRKQHGREISLIFITLPYKTKKEARYLIWKCYLKHTFHQQKRSLNTYLAISHSFHTLHNDMLGRTTRSNFFPTNDPLGPVFCWTKLHSYFISCRNPTM